MNRDEFYIGWMPNAPDGIKKHVRKVVLVLICFIIIAGIVLAPGQKKFATSSFEFGSLTELKGVYQQLPVPSLKVMAQNDAFGNATYVTIPLVGYGKFGAEGVITWLEKEKNVHLDKKEVTLKGTLLYSDGKTLMQIDQNDQPLIAINNSTQYTTPVITELGPVQLAGEILDPKCYFGVMKPGHGKPHRDCAIRCVAGGISPVFRVKNKEGEVRYYLILDENGKKLNETLKDHIAEPVSLTASAVQFDDWIVLYTNRNSIKRIDGISWNKQQDETISCSPR